MTKAQKIRHLEKFTEIASGVRVCMLLTEPVNKAVQGRPMLTAHVEPTGTLWFFTNEYSRKIREISRNNEVFLTYSSPQSNSYMFVAGNAELVDNAAKMKELYTPAIDKWFPKGLQDSRLMLLKVVPHDAEYWDGSSNKMVVLFKMLRAALKKEEYRDGEHARIHLN